MTVVIATHNRSRQLLETVGAILAQTHRELEVFIVDDGSTDDTHVAVAGLDDPRVRYVSTRHWGGPARPRNVGLSLARGAYVAFCDDDDVWLPDKLAQQLAVMAARPELGLVYVLYIEVRGGQLGHEVLPRPRWRVRGPDAFRQLYLAASIPLSGVLVRTEVARASGGFAEVRALISCEDSDLWMRIAGRSAIDYVPAVLFHYRADGDSVSRRRLWRTFRAAVCLQLRHRDRAGTLLCLWSLMRYAGYFTLQWLRSLARRTPPARASAEHECA